ncbi:DUF5802 family protein [Haloarchaeobius sp. DFWS5]|uniref:DUF5802 family protein n=1 Tax=Haloarchaeobius sp. DFWS5 TaxID=3446114 RepID=UPI003EBE9EA0
MFEPLNPGFVVGRLAVVSTTGDRPTLGVPEFTAAADSAGALEDAYLLAHLSGCYLRVWSDSTTPAETLAVPGPTLLDYRLPEGPGPVLIARRETARRLDRWLG